MSSKTNISLNILSKYSHIDLPNLEGKMVFLKFYIEVNPAAKNQ
jgi:hypothetical protein